MSFQDEIVKLQRTRRAYLRLALAENSQTRTWYGRIDRRYSKVDDSVGLVPVFGTVNRFGQIQRSLSNFLYTLEVPNVTVELSDPEGEWRAYVGGTTDQLILRNLSLWLRVHDDLGDTVYENRLAVMQIRKPTFLPGGKVQLDCEVASGGFLGDKIPRRFITNSDWPHAPVESQGLPVPFWYGVLRNDVSPFSFEGGGTGPGGIIPSFGTAVLGRLYPLNGQGNPDQQDAAVHGGLLGAAGPAAGWWSEITAFGTPSTLSRHKADQVVNGWFYNFAFEDTNINTAVPNGRFIYELDAALTIRGTFNLCFPRAGNYPTAASKECHWAVHIWVTKGRTGTVRGTLLNRYTEPVGTNNLPGSGDEQVMRLNAPVTLTPVAALAGDLVVVEVGFIQYDNPGDAAYMNAQYLYWGTKGSDGVPLADLVEGQTPSTTSIFGNLDWQVSPPVGASWVEFAPATGETPPPPTEEPTTGGAFAVCATPEDGGPIVSNGGAIRAIRVGGYAATAPASDPSAGVIAPLSPPVATGTVVGPGGTGHYEYVVTAVAGIPGAPSEFDFAGRTNHIGETTPSNVVSITNGPTIEGTTASGGSFSLDNYIHLTWALIPGAQFYRVYGRRPGGPYSLLDTWSGEGPSGFGHYNDGEINGRSEFDTPKIDSTPPTENLSGYTNTPLPPAPTSNNIYVLSGHTLNEVTDVFVHKPVTIESPTGGSVDPTTGETVAATTIQSDPVPIRVVEGTDYTQQVMEVNGNRYHVLIFSVPQVSETCEYYEITANIKGAETNGDGSGTLIVEAVDVVEHIMLNWILNTYRSSTGPYAPAGGPWFTDVPYAPGLWDAAAANVARAVSAGRIDGGYQFAGGLDKTLEARELIHELLVSGDLGLSFSNLNGTIGGSWSLTMLNLGVSPGGLSQYDPTNSIFAATFQIGVEDEMRVNVFPFFAGPTTQTLDLTKNRDGGGWLISGELPDGESIALYGTAVSEPLYLRWTRDPATALNVVTHYLAYLRFPPQIVRFRTGLQPIIDRVGDLTRVSHPDGTGGPWTDHVCQLLRNDVDADRLVSDVTLMSFNHLMP